MLSSHEVIRRPVITEKNTMLNTEGKYLFEVAQEANKLDVKRAVEEVFNVRVARVNIINVKGKLRRSPGRRRTEGYTRSWKKAIVTLVPGDRIELYEGV
ncbi:MAG: 50S ribosomal protein L23 [Chloroflexi bacterium]|nr:50S ribosomal protein L23 [Chloroflexota bacterium]